jgi:hypothetical protein
VKHDLDAAIREAARVRGGPLVTDDAKRELIANVLAEPQDAATPSPASETSGRSHPFSLVGQRSIAFAIPAIVAVAAIVLSLGLGTSPSGSPATALANAIERLVRVSPHVLAEAPGWKMEAASQTSAGRGEIRFFKGGGEPTRYLDGGILVTEVERAQLEWRSRPAGAGRVPGPGRGYVFEGTAPVLGVRARVFRHVFHPSPAAQRRSIWDPTQLFFGERKEYVAIWAQSGRALTFRSSAPDRRAFEHRLGSLALVTGAEWHRALPGHRVRHKEFAVAEDPAEGVLAPHCTRPISPADVPAEERPQARAYNYICRNPALSTGFQGDAASPATTGNDRK